MRLALVLALTCLVSPALAACLAADPGLDPAGDAGDALDVVAALIGEPIDVVHDHRDPSLHEASHNLAFVSWSTLGVELGENGYANFVFHEDDDEELAFIAVDGDDHGGFVIADVSDPTAIEPLGRYDMRGSGFQEVRVTPDGRYAILNVQEVPGADAVTTAGRECTICLHVIDVEDRANPTWVSAFPVEILGSHNMHVEEVDGEVFVFYVAQPLYRPPAGNTATGNYVGIARFVEDPLGARLEKVGEYHHVDAVTTADRSFPHDVIVHPNPITKQLVAYVSHWDGGAITVDVTDPRMPRELSVVNEDGPSDALAIHWYAPEDVPRADGRLIAWSAPEIGQLSTGSGVVRTYDVTDPANVEELGHWELPGDVHIPGQFLMSPHTVQVDQETGLVAVTHYHAGVWILDGTDPENPRHLAFYQPVGDPDEPYAGDLWWKKPNFDPDGFFPNVYQARWKDDLLWVTERGSGMYVLEYTGPVPGSVV